MTTAQLTQDEFKAASPEAYLRLIRDDFRGSTRHASPAEVAAGYRARAILSACISTVGGMYSSTELKHALDGLRLYEDDIDGGSPVLPFEDHVAAILEGVL